VNDVSPVVLQSLAQYLLWHARHEAETHPGELDEGMVYWVSVAKGIVNGLSRHGLVVLPENEYEVMIAAAREVAQQLDAAFGSGYQQCRDELETVLDEVPEGGQIEADSILAALDQDAGLQFETREAKIRRYNEALGYLLEPENLAWFEVNQPELMERLRAAVRKMTQ
jgi:hypothetical protein